MAEGTGIRGILVSGRFVQCSDIWCFSMWSECEIDAVLYKVGNEVTCGMM